ncbi:LLM class F420-dependent oxidoreductase [Protaetiibacter larvae]|uniref:LLM class F420-dependent oxidoreductase n=1 Tax=Protaetiibacter larvae TaxID=2592654 RepID=A0A5C1YAY1_9MICO|nr:LLM class F420-dependent oxidoreductase [Protaetiibacter larvae]QEO10588.1 LLM class F420-dependent oxidoreductase [Protaetiibacter larvae]
MTDRTIRIAVQLAPQHADYGTIRDVVRRVEDLGTDVVFNWDHFFPLSGDPDGLHYEAWTMLAAIAEQTERIEFGPLVNCNSYRNPDLQADMARTVDHISAKGGTGRFIFGTGSGWFERDYTEYGYDFGTVGSRLDALAVDLPRIRARWEKLNPAPTRRIPILIGGGGERKTLRLVAEHADIWHSFSDPETLERKLGILDEHCAAVGRDRSEIEISTGVSIRGMGSLDPAVLEKQHALGVRLFEAPASGPDYDLGGLKALLAWRDSFGA